MCSGGDENHQVASRKQNKSDLTTRKICIPLVPVEYVDYIIGLPERHRGQDGVPLAVHWLRVLAEFRGTREILSWKVGDGSTRSASILNMISGA